MLKIGRLSLDGTPRIVVPFIGGAGKKTLAAAKKCGLDIAELRIDLFSHQDPPFVLKEISKFRRWPVIVTLRSRREGGQWKGSEPLRLKLFRAVIPKAAAVDIELSSTKILSQVVRLAHRAKKPVIVSYHNFDRTPDLAALLRTVKQAKRQGADIVKIAAMTRSRKDLQTLARLTAENAHLNLVIIAMGSRGMVSRIFFPVLGSLMTYARLGRPTAPGQFSCRETLHYLKTFYR